MFSFTSVERRRPAGFYQITLMQSVSHPGEGAAAVLQLGEKEGARDAQTEMDEC